MRKLGMLLLISMLLLFSTSVFAATKTASKSVTRKSWVGIPVYTIGVKGDYTTNGKKISKQTNARTANATHYPGWSCKKKSAKWVSKGSKSSTVRNNSNFFYGLETQWIKIGIQSYDDEIQITVKP